MEAIEMEIYRIEVDGLYFEDLMISAEEDVATAIDVAIDLAQDVLGGSVRGFYLNTDKNLISLCMRLWSNS